MWIDTVYKIRLDHDTILKTDISASNMSGVGYCLLEIKQVVGNPN
jgi:hypothetical protein